MLHLSSRSFGRRSLLGGGAGVTGLPTLERCQVTLERLHLRRQLCTPLLSMPPPATYGSTYSDEIASVLHINTHYICSQVFTFSSELPVYVYNEHVSDAQTVGTSPRVNDTPRELKLCTLNLLQQQVMQKSVGLFPCVMVGPRRGLFGRLECLSCLTCLDVQVGGQRVGGRREGVSSALIGGLLSSLGGCGFCLAQLIQLRLQLLCASDDTLA